MFLCKNVYATVMQYIVFIFRSVKADVIHSQIFGRTG